jgi:hypothetical protein
VRDRATQDGSSIRNNCSDSDVSDGEGNASQFHLATDRYGNWASFPKVDRYHTWKVRLHALMCVGVIAKCSPKLFYEKWSHFITDSHSQQRFQQPQQIRPLLLKVPLFCVILSDPSPKVRSVAANTLASIIDSSKKYLMAANER